MKKFTLLLIAALLAVVAKAQTLVTVPVGAQFKTYTLEASGHDFGGDFSVKRNVMVAFDGPDVYLQGLSYTFPESYVKGSLDSDKEMLFVSSGQYVGTDGYYGDKYICGLDECSEKAKYNPYFVFNYDAETGVLSMVNFPYYGETGATDGSHLWNWFDAATFTPGPVVLPDLVEAPADLETESCQFKATDLFYHEEDVRYVQVGFYGNDKVYIQGLSSYLPDAWVVGTLSGNTLTIPETYIGVCAGAFGDMYLYFSDATFTYNKDAKQFYSEKGFSSYEKASDTYKMDEYADVYITKVEDVAATPANPSVTEFLSEDAFPRVALYIPAVDVDGNAIATDKLYYQIYIEKDGTRSALTLAADQYKFLDEDMTLIPYEYDDDYDIYKGGAMVYLNQGVDEVATWTNIGVKSIYKGGGETHESDIGWMSTTGISDIKADVDLQKAVIYNLAGQRLKAPKKGINIINGRKVVIK